MGVYSLNNRMVGAQQALTTTMKTQVNLIGAATRRALVWEFMVGADGAPNATDCQIVYDVATKDVSTAGTSTPATPVKTNPADGAAVLTAAVNYSAEATVYTPMVSLALNQRASQKWTAYGPDQMLIMAATATIGLGFRALSPTYAANVLVNVMFDEQ
jgi:hypothetical protein